MPSIDLKVCDHVDIFCVSIKKKDSFPPLSKLSKNKGRLFSRVVQDANNCSGNFDFWVTVFYIQHFTTARFCEILRRRGIIFDHLDLGFIFGASVSPLFVLCFFDASGRHVSIFSQFQESVSSRSESSRY